MAHAMPNTLVHSFAPVAARDARVLILGSMPGVASLQAQQYYAHPRNAFWRLVGEITGVAADAPYAQRTAALRATGIALWDVLQACIRPGSLDADIDERSIVPNDLAGFLQAHPGVGHLFFNGAKAADSFRRHVRPRLGDAGAALAMTALPSTSPANASYSLQRKRAAWQAVAAALAASTSSPA